MFSFEQLRGFVAVADERHFGRAAERLSMTQPPLSRQIQKLERAVGARLFERDNRKVELTPAGAAFLVEARRLLALAESAPDLARRISAGSAGTVRIGFTAASAYAVLPDLLRQLRSELPDLDLVLSELVTRQQLHGLEAHELDLGLARGPFDRDLFGSRVIHREALHVAVPHDHRLAGHQGAVTAQDLRGEPVIMHSPERARYFHELVVRLVDVDPANVVHTVDQVLTMMLLVSAGLGIAFVPSSVSRLGIAGVHLLPLETLEPEPVALHLLWARDSRNPALRQVLDRMPKEF
ncbi:MAG TPA: LysR family transcriptional regulator [Flexivirga sp.]|uniref:LysR family transcriptional regulator n=1 Tax=Flexivirga sp. TaxID=1962927 RepID=UPI002CA03635|nr:LysR family transcriptional regulator [Flexivirga sp.]HWC22485.1 LysR family transcriptional regulator [Flexivirga sp.]